MNEETLLAAAKEKTNPIERANFLDQACAGDAALQARLEARIQSDSACAATKPHKGKTDDGSRSAPPLDETVGTRIGAYTLLEKLGEGGMGAVYRAKQETPVRRQVALKIIKAGADSVQIVTRFRQELLTLARMDHPNIAKVLDAGTTDTGRPFFVMELVQGVPITKFCDDEHLKPEERLRLFISVCQAVQHAHQKGVIHRDLKPSNVLVALYDGKAVPKVIDFGVAKPTRESLTAHTQLTEVGQIIGTLQYMSPEQAEFNNLDVDTRTDIYALGVLLYELLTGSTPLDRQRLKQTGFTEVLRIIREDEPDKPSTRLSRSGAALQAIAAQRRTEPKQLSNVLTGDLDWIVMKALAKERDQRYESATSLASDIERHLADEPVLAGPPSVGYRLRKFVRRHRGKVGAAGLVLATLVAGIVGTTGGMIWAWHAEGAARAAQDKTQLALTAETRARQRTREALNAMTDDVIEKLLAQQPFLGADEKAFLRRVLTYYEDFAKEQGDTEEARAVDAEGQLQVARLRAVLGERREAEQGYQASIRQYERLVAEFPTNRTYRKNLAASHNNLGVLLVELGNREPAVAAYARALELREQLTAEFSNVPAYRQDLAASHNNLGVVLRDLKERDDAARAFQRAQELREHLVSEFSTVPEYRQQLAGSRVNYGMLLKDMGKRDQAEAAYRQALDILDKLMAEYPAVAAYRRDLAWVHNNLGVLLYVMGRRPEAETAFKRSLELREKQAAAFPAVPDYKIDLAGSYTNFGRTLRDHGQVAESLDWFGKAIGLLEGILKVDRRVAVARGFLRNAYRSQAESLDMLHRHADAAEAWGKGVELADGPMRDHFRLSQAAACSRAGDHRAASATAADLARIPDLEGGTLYNLGCIYARCATAAKDDDALRDSYAAKAVTLLGQAKTAGMFKDAKEIEDMKKDSDLGALRQRDDYRKLLKDLEASVAAPNSK